MKNILITAILFLSLVTTSCSFTKSEAEVQKLCIENKTNQESITCLNDLISKEPGNYEAFKFLTGIYNSQVDYPKAMETLEKAARIKPDDPDIYDKLGSYYMFYKQNDKAIENYEKAVKLGTKSSAAYFNLGNVYMRVRNYPKAIEAFKTAKEINPSMANDLDAMIKRLEQDAAGT